MGYRDEFAAALARAEALERSLAAQKSARAADQARIDELSRELEGARAQLAEAERKLDAAGLSRMTVAADEPRRYSGKIVAPVAIAICILISGVMRALIRAPSAPTAPVPVAPRGAGGLLPPEVATPLLTVESQPSGAEVLIDGVRRGETPYSGPVEFGTRRIELRAAGKTITRTLVITTDTTLSLSL